MQRRVVDRRILSSNFTNNFWMVGWMDQRVDISILEEPMVIERNEGGDAIMERKYEIITFLIPSVNFGDFVVVYVFRKSGKKANASP